MRRQFRTAPTPPPSAPAAAPPLFAALSNPACYPHPVSGVRVLETCAAEDGTVSPSEGVTRKFIYPGYRFRAVDALLTNFHLPRSSLLALVMAFAGVEAVRAAYRAAVAEEYRFYSYGDAMLIT